MSAMAGVSLSSSWPTTTASPRPARRPRYKAAYRKALDEADASLPAAQATERERSLISKLHDGPSQPQRQVLPSKLAQQVVVFCMRADPEPEDIIAFPDPDRPIMQPDASREDRVGWTCRKRRLG